jgi:Domain of unknown function (DUF5753)
MGYDDIPVAGFVDPPLTTIRQPMRQVGCQGGDHPARQDRCGPFPRHLAPGLAPAARGPGGPPEHSPAPLIRSYEALFVPGLLQTAEYLRALMCATLHDRRPEKIERWVKLRLNRQQLLTRPDPPQLWVAGAEAASAAGFGAAARRCRRWR